MGGTLARERATTAVIGGGAGGLLAVIHLARSGRPRHVVVFEPGTELGAGVAYGTDDASHCLNVPARLMSASDEDPADFARWLSSQDSGFGPDDYPPRQLFRRYLQDAARRALAASGGAVSMRWVRASVQSLDIGHRTTGGVVRVGFGAGRTLPADDAILAVGAPSPSVLSSFGLPSSPRLVCNPWQPGALDGIPGDAEVLILGTGLTMIDIALTLATRGQRSIRAVSRHGRLPQVHTGDGFAPWPGLDLTGVSSATETLRRFRRALDEARAAGSDWRNVVSAARASLPRAWSGLPVTEQERLLRHVAARWENNRHRMGPDVSSRIDALIDSGRVNVTRGTALDIAPGSGGARLFSVTLGSSTGREHLRVGAIVDCTGAGSVSHTGTTLVARLIADGLLRQHPSGLGIDVDESGGVLTLPGQPEPSLWSIGWVRRGSCYESTAIPELRRQAAGLAMRITSPRPDPARTLNGDDRRHGWSVPIDSVAS